MGRNFTFFIVITSFRECFNYKHFCYVVKLKCSDILRESKGDRFNLWLFSQLDWVYDTILLVKSE